MCRSVTGWLCLLVLFWSMLRVCLTWGSTLCVLQRGMRWLARWAYLLVVMVTDCVGDQLGHIMPVLSDMQHASLDP